MPYYFLLFALVITINLDASQKKEEKIVHEKSDESLKRPGSLLEESPNKKPKMDPEGRLEKWLNKYFCSYRHPLGPAIKMDLPSGYCYTDNAPNICNTFSVDDSQNACCPVSIWCRWQCAKFAKIIVPDEPLPGIAEDQTSRGDLKIRNWGGRKVIILPRGEGIASYRLHMITNLKNIKYEDILKYINCRKCFSDLMIIEKTDKFCSIHKRFPDAMRLWDLEEKIREKTKAILKKSTAIDANRQTSSSESVRMSHVNSSSSSSSSNSCNLGSSSSSSRSTDSSSSSSSSTSATLSTTASFLSLCHQRFQKK